MPADPTAELIAERRYGEWQTDKSGRWREFYGPFVCGEHFCDSCGDCMVCYGDDPCPYLLAHRCIEEEH